MNAYFFSDMQISHSRRIYGIFDLFGELGGVIEILFIVSGALLGSISEHSFTIKAISKFFMANTKDENIFLTRQSKKAK